MGKHMDEYRALEEKAVGRKLSDEEWRQHWVSRWNGAYVGAQLADDWDELGSAVLAALPSSIRSWFKKGNAT